MFLVAKMLEEESSDMIMEQKENNIHLEKNHLFYKFYWSKSAGKMDMAPGWP